MKGRHAAALALVAWLMMRCRFALQAAQSLYREPRTFRRVGT
jgi:hypothetical protein